MPKVVLHVGTHKTGTTALQNSLSASRGELEACGICYDPNLGGKRSRASEHHALARILAEPDTDDARQTLNGYQDFIRRQLDLGHDVVISSERFCRMELDDGLPREGARHRYLDRVAHFFAGMQVEIIVYFRRPDRYIESLYKERAIKPTRLSFEGILAPKLTVSYALRLQEFEATFEHVSCFCFEHAVADGLVRNFLRRHALADRDLAETDVRRQGVSFRAALWLHARKMQGATDAQAVRQMWLFCLDMGRHPLLKDAKSDRPWTSSEQRAALYSRMVDGFRHADFWSPPADDLTPVDAQCVDLDAIDSLYEDWLQRNQLRLELRRKRKLPPYAPDPEFGLGERLALRTRQWFAPLAKR